jgi:hypothetical protein
MKQNLIKIIISFIAIITIGAIVYQLMRPHQAESEGVIYLLIQDEDNQIVYDGEIPFFEGDTFYDILAREFSLICATQTYQADDTCAYTFNTIIYQGKVILGISGNDFELLTDWSHTFLAFEVLVDNNYVLSTQGPSHQIYQDQDYFRISVRRVSG